MKQRYATIDFEYTDVSEEKLRLVCCSLQWGDTLEEYWLLNNPEAVRNLQETLGCLDIEGYIFLAHAASAEASSLISMGLDATKFKWICTRAEFLCLSNHNHDLMYGTHLVNGRIKTLYPPKPKWQQTEEDKKRKSGGKLTHSLAQLVFKMLGKQIDTEHKTKMRDIIISGDEDLIEENRKAIQDYCSSDIKYLLPCFRKIVGHYKELLTKEDFKLLKGDMLLRGRAMADTAKMERFGYPIAFNNLRNFALQLQDIMNECAEDINRQFPDMNVFVMNKSGPSKGSYTMKQAPIKEWIATLPYADNWVLTDKKAYSLSLDAFQKFFNFSHNYPEGNFGAQILRYLVLKQSVFGFSPNKKGKNFWDAVGKDKRVRPYLNPYGSQSARFQPPSTTFLFLKSAWYRSLCVPRKGKMIVGIDYKSEEFLISGLWARDMAMIEAYKSGDVYMAYAMDAGMAPVGATKATHGLIRDAAKPAVLGISYLMTKYGLSIDMTNKLGREVDEDEAQEFIDSFNEAYHVHYDAVQDFLEDFSDAGYLRLGDGWCFFGDQENFRSVANTPKQGAGSCILRKAIQLSHDKGLDICFPLHDALYFEVDLNDWEAVNTAVECMKEAFVHYYKGTDMEKYAELIMVDVEAWSPELDKKTINLSDGQEVSVESIHIDPRGKKEYDKFSKYFKKAGWMLL